MNTNWPDIDKEEEVLRKKKEAQSKVRYVILNGIGNRFIVELDKYVEWKKWRMQCSDLCNKGIHLPEYAKLIPVKSKVSFCNPEIIPYVE